MQAGASAMGTDTLRLQAQLTEVYAATAFDNELAVSSLGRRLRPAFDGALASVLWARRLLLARWRGRAAARLRA